MDPAKYDITIHQGATFALPIRYEDSTGTPVNMSGYTVEAKLYNRFNNQKFADFGFDWDVQASGAFRITLEDTVTSGITEQGCYDVLVTNPDGDKNYLLEGIAFLNPGVSYR